MLEFFSFLEDTQELVYYRTTQNFVNGVCLLFMIMRLLKNLDFQPRLGLVTRTLQIAIVNLTHFMVVFFMVFGAYAIFGHVAFGGELEQFSTFKLSLNACFGILLGDHEVTNDFADSDNGVVGFIFYYSFIIVLFFVLLNILLAILVDAYMEVKEVAEDSKTVVEEIIDVLIDGRANPFKKNKLGGDKRTSEVNKFANQMLFLIQEQEKKEKMKQRQVRRASMGMAKEAEFDHLMEHNVRKFKLTKKVHVEHRTLFAMMKDQLEAVRAEARRGGVEDKNGYLDNDYLEEMSKSIVRIYGRDEAEEEVLEEEHAAEAVLATIQELSAKQAEEAKRVVLQQQKQLGEFSKQIEGAVKRGGLGGFRDVVNKERMQGMIKKKDVGGVVALVAASQRKLAKEGGSAVVKKSVVKPALVKLDTEAARKQGVNQWAQSLKKEKAKKNPFLAAAMGAAKVVPVPVKKVEVKKKEEARTVVVAPKKESKEETSSDDDSSDDSSSDDSD